MELQVLSGEQRTLLQGVSWSTYESLLADLGEHRGRIAYDNGMLEIMAPSKTHEGLKRIIGRLLETYSLEMGIEILSTSSLTLKRSELLKGAEADESYYVQNEAQVRHKDIDLAVDPPPDLAIEVEISRSALDRLGIYAGLGVPELWRHDGNSLRVYLLSADGKYHLSEKSRAFSALPLEEFRRFLARWTSLSETQLVISFRDWVRGHRGRRGVKSRKPAVNKKLAEGRGRRRKPST
jgi:Uma2 family endonuclease